MNGMPPQLHLNENLSPDIAEALRRQGFDVTSTIEMGMLRTPDAEQLAWAASARRAILTFNVKHFVPLHLHYMSEGLDHWGIVLSTQETNRTVIRRLINMLVAVGADDLRNQLRWLNEFR